MMIVTKLFEVRDRMTFIPVMATSIKFSDEKELFLLGQAGYYGDALNLILVCQLGSGRTEYEEYAWVNQGRTMPAAHRFIQEHFDLLQTGDVIDVREVLGEV